MLTVLNSDNRKLGKDVSATYRSKISCPTTCGVFKQCYAKFGYGNIQFVHAGIKKAISDTKQLVNFIKSLPIGRKVRGHVSGDVIKNNSKGNTIDRTYVRGFIRAINKRPDLKYWSYSHAWKLFKTNPFKNLIGANINASLDNLNDVPEAKAKGWDCVAVVPESTSSGYYNGHFVKICPAQIAPDKVTCSNCMLCFQKNRSYVIGFRAHGNGKNGIHLNRIEGYFNEGEKYQHGIN